VLLEIAWTRRGEAIRIDKDLLAWFRGLGRGCQARINAVLRAWTEARSKAGGCGGLDAASGGRRHGAWPQRIRARWAGRGIAGGCGRALADGHEAQAAGSLRRPCARRTAIAPAR
jgi:hypothetical protein